MKPQLKERILAFNRASAQSRQKAADLDILVSAMAALPPGQLKKLLSDEVLAVLSKYGLQ